MVDVATGEALLDRNPGTVWYPASLTKMMTIYIVFEELKAGRLTLSTTLPFSENARNKPGLQTGRGAGAGDHRGAGSAGARGSLLWPTMSPPHSASR